MVKKSHSGGGGGHLANNPCFLFVFYFHVISYHAPFGAQRLSLYTARAEGPSLLWGWGWDFIS